MCVRTCELDAFATFLAFHMSRKKFNYEYPMAVLANASFNVTSHIASQKKKTLDYLK